MANPVYVTDFNYFSASIPGREDYIEDSDSEEDNDCEQSDMVNIIVNLAYIRQEAVRNFHFGPGYSKMLGDVVRLAKMMKFKTAHFDRS